VLSRARFGARVQVLDWIRVYGQLQDARAWGSEDNTLTDASADNLDMHQVYAELGRSSGLRARLGRQSMALADERLVGAVEWTNTGRSFDGVRLIGEASGINWTAFAMNVAERDELLVVGLDPQLNQGEFDDGWLVGGFAARDLGDVRSELTVLFDRDAITDQSTTVNLRLLGRLSEVSYEAAAAYQFGPGRRAWFASGKASLAVSRADLAAQVDFLSGDGDPDDARTKAFNTMYATNHKFYGYMDYFLAIPEQLDQAGLIDIMLRASTDVFSNSTLRLDLHRLLTASERGGERGLGTELDAVGQWSVAPPAHLEVGLGIFVPDDLVTALLPAFAAEKQTTWWGYAQFTLRWP
jgi:hypothetical protein